MKQERDFNINYVIFLSFDYVHMCSLSFYLKDFERVLIINVLLNNITLQ